MEKFLSNHSQETFLEHIKANLNSCDEFIFSVSFIKYAGLILFENELVKALNRGVKGRIITSTYQNFTDVKSLYFFQNLMDLFPNFECHLEYHSFGKSGFHTKGYLFVKNDATEVIVGSSNITRFALLHNFEWNASIKHTNNHSLYNDFRTEFDMIWNNTYQLDKSIIDQYRLQLEYAVESWDMDVNFDTKRIEPNLMQRAALKEIRRLRNIGEKKALVIAATGSGKTYLAAFDSFNFEAHSLLFICHRENILIDAMKTFKSVFGDQRTYSLFTGNNELKKTNFIFSTNIMMTTHLEEFKENDFSYIIIDEVHHAVASTYQKILRHFEPDFLLGLTATPERLDNFDVFSIFENNVPYELRLRDALDLNLIVPFHYFGIKDEYFEYDKLNKKYIVDKRVYNQNIEFIAEKIEEKRHTLANINAIGFCSSVIQAKSFSESFADLGYKTTYLTGESTIGERILAFKNLQDEDNTLEIIFTVDILNEGIDVPAINLVLFLRPTESPIIFVQQLGRGLRKYPNKDHLVVLDFIGNSYTRSVQIALAVGSLTENIIMDKIVLKDYIKNNFQGLPENLIIEFDEKAKEEILNSIEKTNFNSFEFLKSDYFNIKKYRSIKRYIRHIDLLDSEIISNPYRFIKNYKCYYNFLLKVEGIDNIPLLSEQEVSILEYLTSMLPIARPYEIVILIELLEDRKLKNELQRTIEYRYMFRLDIFEHSLKNLQNQLVKDINSQPKLIKVTNGFISLNFNVNENPDFKVFLSDLLSYAIEEYNVRYNEFTGKFVLYGHYSRKQYLLMQLKNQYIPQQGILFDNNEVYFFIDLIKKIGTETHLQYSDKFITPNILIWESQTGTTIENAKGKKLLSYKKAHLFVRKKDKEDGISLPYTYLGIGIFGDVYKTTNIKKTVSIKIELEHFLPRYLQVEFMNLEDKYEKVS